MAVHSKEKVFSGLDMGIFGTGFLSAAEEQNPRPKNLIRMQPFNWRTMMGIRVRTLRHFARHGSRMVSRLG